MAHHHHHHNQHHHAHAHAQCSAHDHSNKTLGERNKEHFDGVAATAFDVPWIKKLTEQVSDELRNNFVWINVSQHKSSDNTKLLDYACGNGVVSRSLAPHITTCRGIDISSQMVEQYNLIAGQNGHSAQKMHAVHGDLLDAAATPSSDLESVEYQDFDFAVMSLALHHVDDVDGMISQLAGRLREGGVLVIVDWVAASESGCIALPKQDTSVAHTVHHMGFEEEELKKSFQKARLGDWGWKWFDTRSEVPGEVGNEMQAFLARGVKKA